MLLTRSFKCKTKANLDLISRVPVSVPALFSPRFFPGLFPETGLGYVRTCLCILIRDLSRYNLLFIIICFFFSFACTFILSSSHSFRFSRFQAIDIRLGFFRIILFSLSSFLNAYVLVYWYISFATLPSSSSSLSSTSLSSFVSLLPIQRFNRLPSSPFTV